MTTISLRFNEKDKSILDEICEDMGMNLTTLFNVYAKKIIRERKIPFVLEAPSDPFYSESNMKALKESIRQINEGKVITKTIKELEKYE